MSKQVFISYSFDEKNYADLLCDRLESAGITCWIAPRDIRAGQSWAEAIVSGIDGSALLLLLLSARSNDSRYVVREVELADGRGKPLFTVRLEDIRPSGAMEFFLRLPQSVDCFRDAFETRLGYVVEMVAQCFPNESVPSHNIPLASQPQAHSSIDIMPQPFKWIWIPAGKVTLAEGGYVPIGGHMFDVPAFEIAKYPITNAQYALFVEAEGYRDRRWWTDTGWRVREEGWCWTVQNRWEPTGKAWVEPRWWLDSYWNSVNQPVVGISWYEALAFCTWLSATTAENIMLPTEQQWQRAAQGDDGRAYPWGDRWNHSLCTNNGSPTTHVTAYEGVRGGASPFGVADMAGNVLEWCATSWDDSSQDANPTDVRYILRGGSWFYSDSSYFRTDCRLRDFPHARLNDSGFRLARAAVSDTVPPPANAVVMR